MAGFSYDKLKVTAGRKVIALTLAFLLFYQFRTCCLCSENVKCKGCRRYGMEDLPDRLEINKKAGIIYHREGIKGDYDEFDDVEELIRFIQTGK